ncbi:MAG: hypothetical protein WC563_15710 [Brevundimonas sp.]
MNLRVLARGDIKVQDVVFENATGSRRYIGRSAVHAWKEEDLPANEQCRHVSWNLFLSTGDKPIPHVAYPKNSAPVEVPMDRYYTRAIQNGELWAADQSTAACVGVAFDPDFGGEYPSLKTAAKSSKVGA